MLHDKQRRHILSLEVLPQKIILYKDLNVKIKDLTPKFVLSLEV